MKKEDTRERLVWRKYEATHKEERKRAAESSSIRGCRGRTMKKSARFWRRIVFEKLI